MAIFTTNNIMDIEQLKSLSTHISNILDKESTINSQTNLLSLANIAALNTLYATVLADIQTIVSTAP